MTPERYKFLSENLEADLTPEEIKKGWCFCFEWDGLLINRFRDEEATVCNCVWKELKKDEDNL